MSTITNLAGLVGRLLLAGLFVWSGYGKLINPAGSVQYMQSGGVPAFFIWPVIAAEIGGGLALAAGFLTRLSAFGLAVFTAVAGVLFHAKFGDMGQTVHFAKNMAITGGLLSFVMSGAGPLSLDALLWRRDTRE